LNFAGVPEGTWGHSREGGGWGGTKMKKGAGESGERTCALSEKFCQRTKKTAQGSGKMDEREKKPLLLIVEKSELETSAWGRAGQGNVRSRSLHRA